MQTILLMHHKNTVSPHAEAYSDLITPHQSVKLAVFGCPSAVVAVDWYARPQLQKSRQFSQS